MIGIVLAAGYGTRLGELGANNPKALLPVGNQTIIDHLLDRFVELNLRRVVIVINGHFRPAFETWMKYKHHAIPMELLCDGSTSPENRLGAVRDLDFALDHIDSGESVFVSASDNLYTSGLMGMVEQYREKKAPVIAMIRETDPEKLRRTGVAKIRSNDGRVLSFVEKPAEPASSYACPGLYVYPPDIRKEIADSLLEPEGDRDAPGHLVAYLVNRRPVYGKVLEGKRYDIGSMETYREAQQIFSSGSSL